MPQHLGQTLRRSGIVRLPSHCVQRTVVIPVSGLHFVQLRISLPVPEHCSQSGRRACSRTIQAKTQSTTYLRSCQQMKQHLNADYEAQDDWFV